MSRSFRRYTLAEYIDQVLKPAVGKVRFPELHIHGTWRPTIADFRRRPGEYYIQAMYRFHRLQGWQDIAQHVTVDPDGFIWAGRSLFLAPASASGFNDSDNDGVHPFMVEIIGNFDKGKERLEGPQLATSAGLFRAEMDLFGSIPHLHREFTDKKTCPGSGIEKGWLLGEIAKAGIQKVKPPPVTPDPIKIKVNGKHDSWGSLIDNETWVYARQVGTTLGAAIDWNGDCVTVNGKPLATRVIGGRGYVPVRELAQACGAAVEWDAKTNTVLLTI